MFDVWASNVQKSDWKLVSNGKRVNLITEGLKLSGFTVYRRIENAKILERQNSDLFLSMHELCDVIEHVSCRAEHSARFCS